MNNEKSAVCAALTAWVNQRPGLSPEDYGPGPYYRAESRKITQQKNDFFALLHAVERRDGLTADNLHAAFKSAFAGRLSWDGAKLDYCTGQYWPTEYRAAACAVLAAALWAYWREDDTASTGTSIRRIARNNLGVGIARRWFN